jgi:hypothetical protein
MCVAPNLRAIALCETLHGNEHAAGGAAGGMPPSDSKLDDADDGGGSSNDGKSQISVYHVASRRKMRTMSLPIKGGMFF